MEFKSPGRLKTIRSPCQVVKLVVKQFGMTFAYFDLVIGGLCQWRGPIVFVLKAIEIDITL